MSLVKFPPLCQHLGEHEPFHAGWLYAAATKMLESAQEMINLCVAIPYSGRNLEKYNVNDVTYYLVPVRHIATKTPTMVRLCQEVIDLFNPDIIHIHGTEFSLAAAMCEANGKHRPIIASIQGLADAYTRYADGGISLKNKLINITPLDIYRGTYMLTARKRFARRGVNEIAIVRGLTDIIGRTDWDRIHVESINPEIHYHFCNETLRPSFYESKKWTLADCDRYSVFVSNSGEPLKGAHQIICALPFLISKYPDIKVRIIGRNVLSNKSCDLIHFMGYQLYLRRLICRLGVKDYVEFLGALSEQEMRDAFIRANVYALTSCIENSPNSLCEAQIIGTPVVASYVGGVPSLVENGKTGLLYRYEEYEMLAAHIAKIFDSSDHELRTMSEAEIAVATTRHEGINNAQTLTDIYQSILKR